MRGLRKFGQVDYHISLKLRKFRIEQGISLEELAELTGISFQQLQKYEKTINRISASKLFEFSYALNKPIAAFFEGVRVGGKYYEYKIKSEKRLQKENAELDKDLLPLIRSFNRIENIQIKRHIVNLVQEISGPFRRKRIKHEFS